MNHNPTQTRETPDVYSRPSAYFDGDHTLVVRGIGCIRLPPRPLVCGH